MRKQHIGILLAILLLFGYPAYVKSAADIFVDKDNGCPGAGTSGDPYCSIQNAFDNVTAGGTIKIRDGATAYNEAPLLTTSGTGPAPIVIEPDVGHDPNLTRVASGSRVGAIHIRNASHIVVRGLKFDGAGLQTSRFGVFLENTSASTDMIGILIDNIRCWNWGGSTHTSSNQSGCFRTDSVNSTTAKITGTVRDSDFNGNRFASIYLGGTQDFVVSNNTIQNIKCGTRNVTPRQAHMVGIKHGEDSQGIIVKGNSISVSQSFQDCKDDLTDVTEWNTTGNITVGIYCDTGSQNGQIKRNYVTDLDYQDGVDAIPVGQGESAGIFNESNCDGHDYHYNVITKIGQRCLRNGSHGTGDPDNNTFYHNTCRNIEKQDGLHLIRGLNNEFKNNIFHLESGADVPIEVESNSTGAGHGNVFAGNIYFKDGSTSVGKWSNDSVLTLSTWNSTCSCDSGSLNINPSLTATGTIDSLSDPPVDAGVAITGLSKNGANSTIGAFDPGRIDDATTVDSTHVDFLFVNNVAPPIANPDHTKCTITENAGPTTISAGAVQGSNILRLTTSTLSSGTTLLGTCAASMATDSALIGNTLNQPILGFTDEPITNTLTGGATWVLTQSAFQGYGLPLILGALEKRPIGGTLNHRVYLPLGRSVIMGVQIKCTTADCPARGVKFQGDWNLASSWFDIPAAFDANNLRFTGTGRYNTAEFPGQLFALSGCLNDEGATLTAIAGALERTGQAVPNIDLAQNQCVVLAAMIDADTDLTVGDFLRIRAVNQDGTVFGGTYVYGEIEIVDRQAAAGL